MVRAIETSGRVLSTERLKSSCIYTCMGLASFPGLRGGEGRPGTHCARKRVIIAKCTYENSGRVVKTT